MGNGESMETNAGRLELRNQMMPIRLPMPDPAELERRFTKVLRSSRCLGLSALSTSAWCLHTNSTFQTWPLLMLMRVALMTRLFLLKVVKLFSDGSDDDEKNER